MGLPQKRFQRRTERANVDQNHFDVIVVGAGPAGCTAATILAAAGRSVVVLERERFPVFKIGESLMPGTYWTLARLGLLEKLRASAFPKKFSVQFFSKTGKASRPFYFYENDPHESSKTWQVLRSDFDSMMLENAQKNGAVVHQETRVNEVVFEGGTAVGVKAVFPDGQQKELFSKVVVDASGLSALVSGKLGLKEEERHLKKVSLFSHFDGTVRDRGEDEGATLVMQTRNGKAWFWYIPLPDGVASVGVVGDQDYLLKGRPGSPQEIFDEEIRNCPEIGRRLKNAAQRIEMKVKKEFSYTSKKISGDGWVLVGDAFGFLDPIYSSGVFLALKSGEMAADSILEGFEFDDFSAARLGKFGPQFVEGMSAIRKLVYAFYSEDFSFSKFLEKFPQHRGAIINLLIGNVFRSNFDGTFDDLATMCELPESYSFAVS